MVHPKLFGKQVAMSKEAKLGVILDSKLQSPYRIYYKQGEQSYLDNQKNISPSMRTQTKDGPPATSNSDQTHGYLWFDAVMAANQKRLQQNKD